MSMLIFYLLFSLMVAESRSESEVVVDLTHTLRADRMPLMEGGAPLELIVETKEEGFGARSRYLEFCMDELLGTHMAAPSMYLHLNDTPSVDHVPIQRLVHIPAVVVDLEWTPSDRSPVLTRGHLLDFERRQNRKIPNNGIVLLRTGWDKFFRQTDKFVGHFAKEDKQVFPGFSSDAVRWLLNDRDVLGLGTECIDVELGWRSKHEIKQMLAIRHRYSLLQLTNLDKLPSMGVSLIIAPLKLDGGSGGATRVYAVFDDDDKNNQNNEIVNRLYNDQSNHKERSISKNHDLTSANEQRLNSGNCPQYNRTLLVFVLLVSSLLASSIFIVLSD